MSGAHAEHTPKSSAEKIWSLCTLQSDLGMRMPRSDCKVMPNIFMDLTYSALGINFHSRNMLFCLFLCITISLVLVETEIVPCGPIHDKKILNQLCPSPSSATLCFLMFSIETVCCRKLKTCLFKSICGS